MTVLSGECTKYIKQPNNITTKRPLKGNHPSDYKTLFAHKSDTKISSTTFDGAPLTQSINSRDPRFKTISPFFLNNGFHFTPNMLNLSIFTAFQYSLSINLLFPLVPIDYPIYNLLFCSTRHWILFWWYINHILSAKRL